MTQSAVLAASASPGTTTGFKNRIINGNMMVSQYNGTSSVTPTTGYVIDRWALNASQNSKFTFQQNQGSVTPPAGFTNYLGATTASAVTVGGSDYFALIQRIEGYNVADLGWGTANAKTVTLSFRIYSSLTGTFGGAIRNNDGNRCYPFSYTVSSANTWTTISITIAGDTSGTWLTTNGSGVEVWFGLGVGSTFSGTSGAWTSSNIVAPTGAVSVVGTLSATFYITGVQLEVGTTATNFDFRSIGTELALCQRYYTKFTGDGSGSNGYAIGYQSSTTVSLFCLNYPVTMRSEPTCSISNVLISDGINYDANITLNGITTGYTSGQIEATNSAVGAQFRPFRVLGNSNTNSFIALSSEL